MTINPFAATAIDAATPAAVVDILRQAGFTFDPATVAQIDPTDEKQGRVLTKLAQRLNKAHVACFAGPHWTRYTLLQALRQALPVPAVPEVEAPKGKK